MNALYRSAPTALTMTSLTLSVAAIALAVPAPAQVTSASGTSDAYRPAKSTYVPPPYAVPDNRRPLDYTPRKDVPNGLGGYAPSARNMPAMWQGVYLGAHGGYGWGSTSAANSALGNASTRGAMAGIHAGYNWQSGNAVFGIETDLSSQWLGGHETFAGSGAQMQSRSDWSSTLRARLGYSYSNLMLYATGGIAFADHDLTLTSGLSSSRMSKIHTGYVVGAGVEYKLSSMMRLRGEVLHMGFGEKDYDFAGTTVPTKFDETIVRTGISFQLN